MSSKEKLAPSVRVASAAALTSLSEALERRSAAHLVAEHLAHQALARLLAERRELQDLHAPASPQLREELVHFGARQGQHHPGHLAEIAQRAVNELHRRPIAPVQVLQHQ